MGSDSLGLRAGVKLIMADATELLVELEESEVTVNRAGLSNCRYGLIYLIFFMNK